MWRPASTCPHQRIGGMRLTLCADACKQGAGCKQNLQAWRATGSRCSNHRPHTSQVGVLVHSSIPRSGVRHHIAAVWHSLESKETKEPCLACLRHCSTVHCTLLTCKKDRGC